MWPFKKKGKLTIFNDDFEYILAGMEFARELKKKYPKPK